MTSTRRTWNPLSMIIGTAVAFGGFATATHADGPEPMRFLCESGNVITVLHGAGPDAAGLMLGYQGRTFELYPIQSAGDRFGTEQGLGADRGLRWEMDGNTWHLSEMIMDHSAPDAEILESCTVEDGAPSTSANSNDLPVGIWKATSLRNTSLVHDHEPVATFNADGSITGSTGCNNFGSNAVVSGAGISINNGFMTRMGCEPERHAVERAFLDTLEATVSFETDGRMLTLLDGDGEKLGAFMLVEPSPPEPVETPQDQ